MSARILVDGMLTVSFAVPASIRPKESHPEVPPFASISKLIFLASQSVLQEILKAVFPMPQLRSPTMTCGCTAEDIMNDSKDSSILTESGSSLFA